MDTIYFNKEDNQEYAYIGIIPDFINDDSLNFLEYITDFKGGTTSFGNIPRLQKWYQSDGKYFSKTWKDQDLERWKSNEYEPPLLKLQYNIQDYIDTLDIYKYMGINKPKINSCLINKYRDGNDSIRPHRDNQTTFGDNPTVIGISHGDEREIIFKRIHYNSDRMNSIKPDRDNQQEIRLKLKTGSLFVMAGAIQKYFSHEIPKTDSNDIRYSMTFRQFYE
mgnify:CR=1 FL=1